MSLTVAHQVRLAGIPAIAVNDTYQLAPWANMLYAADEAWWARHPGALDFRGLKVSVGTIKGVLHIEQSSVVAGFDPNPDRICTGSNSGYQALHIAVHAGAKRILLCGFDMRGDHWFGRHPRELANTNEVLFARFRRNFGILAPILVKRGIEVVNCTPGSALTCFQTMGLGDALSANV